MSGKKKVNLFAKHSETSEDKRLSDKPYLDDFISPVKEPTKKEPVADKPVEEEEVGEKQPEIKRATIVVWENDLAEFRNIIHTIKRSGNYQYTQKDAFARAIELLKKEVIQEYGPLQDAPPPRQGRW